MIRLFSIIVVALTLLKGSAVAATIGLWLFDGNTQDSSGNDLHATGSSGIAFVSSVPASSIYDPVSEQSWNVNQSLNLKSSSAANVTDTPASASFTIELFMRFDYDLGDSAFPTVVRRRMQESVGGSTVYSGWLFDMRGAYNEMRFRLDNPGNQNISSPTPGSGTSAIALNDGEWHHVAMTYNSETGVGQVWVDYELYSQRTINGDRNAIN